MIIARVIFCTLNCLTTLGPLPHEILLKRDDGVVLAIQDETLMALLARQAAVSLLYFSRDAYEEAIQGLNKQEVNEVIDLRVKKWAPKVLDEGEGQLYLGERQCLAWTALARVNAAGTTMDVLQVHTDRALDFLARLTYEGRYDDSELTELLVVALERAAKLIAELKDALTEPVTAGEKSALEYEVRAQDTSAKALSAILTRLGQEDFREHYLPYVDLMRGVWIRPRDADLISLIKVDFKPYVEYEDGLVTTEVKRRFVDHERRGKKVSVLYLNNTEVLGLLPNLTPAQRQRDFKVRASATADAKAALRREYLSGLRLELILFKKALRGHAEASTEPGLTVELDAQIRQETALLATELVKHRLWFGVPAAAAEPVRARLLRCEEAILHDIKLLAAVAQHQRDGQRTKELQSFAQSKMADITRSKNLPVDLR